MENIRKKIASEYGSINGMASYEEIDYESACQIHEKYKQAAHVLIFARHDGQLWGIKQHAAIMMQMRFDGKLGFPGGLVDDGESPLEGLNRELQEEICLDLDTVSIQEEDHLISHKNNAPGVDGGIITHFFAKEISLAVFENIEKRALGAKDWGGECLGLLRVPLYNLTKNGKKSANGFPAFLSNTFVGTAKLQLIEAISAQGIIPLVDLVEMYDIYSDSKETGR